jgi:Papain family cysteine protease
MIDFVLNKGTLAVALDASLWGSYRGGIFSSCTSSIKINHGVNIVGVNTVERYWIIRNSWGPWWGEKGYMRLAMVSARIIAFETVCETLCFATMLRHVNSTTSPLPRTLGLKPVRGCILGWVHENRCC